MLERQLRLSSGHSITFPCTFDYLPYVKAGDVVRRDIKISGHFNKQHIMRGGTDYSTRSRDPVSNR